MVENDRGVNVSLYNSMTDIDFDLEFKVTSTLIVEELYSADNGYMY